MNDKVLMAIGACMSAAGGIIAGALIRQPEINKLQKQVEMLQADLARIESVAEEQNREISQMLITRSALKVYQFSKRSQMKNGIQDRLICQYAAADYLTLLLDHVSSDIEMNSEEIKFYKLYARMIEDNRIDDDELAQLKPIMMKRHGREIEEMQTCDMKAIFERIRRYGEKGSDPKPKGLFRK